MALLNTSAKAIAAVAAVMAIIINQTPLGAPGRAYHKKHIEITKTIEKNMIQGFRLPLKSAIEPSIGLNKATDNPAMVCV